MALNHPDQTSILVIGEVSNLAFPEKSDNQDSPYKGFLNHQVVLLVDKVQGDAVLKVWDEEEKVVAIQKFSNHLDQPLRLILKVPSGRIHFSLENEDGILLHTPIVSLANQIKTIYYMSCDHQEADTHGSLWGTLEEEIKVRQGLTLCLHLGDNVYADAAWHKARKNPEKDPRAIYRKRYRKVWSTGKRPNVYSSASHLMIWDDHEIVNNLVLRHVTNRITDAAVSVYQEYQEALHLQKKTFLGAGWYKIINGILLVTLERTTSGIVTSSEIINRLEEILTDDVRGIILCSSWAPIPPPEGNHYAELSSSLGTTQDYLPKEELYSLYDYLLDWSTVDHPVLMVGGDIHFGVHARVRKGFKRIEVMAASPISNHPSYDRRLTAKAYEKEFSIGGDLTFSIFSARGNRCYGRTIITKIGDTGYHFDNTLIYNEKQYPKNPLKYLRSVSKMAGL